MDFKSTNLQVALTLASAIGIACVPAWAGIAEDVDAALAGRPLLLYGESPEEARALRADLALDGIDVRLTNGADVTESDLAVSDLLVFGTPETNPLIRRYLASTPLSLTRTSVTVGDSTYRGTDVRLVASLPHPHDRARKCILYAAQGEELLAGIFFGYGASRVSSDFLVYRKSDGLYYADDRLAYGQWLPTDPGRVLGETIYESKAPRRLQEIVVGHVQLYYDTFTAPEAKTIARFVDELRSVATDDFGIRMPQKIYVYLYRAAVVETRVQMYTDAWNTFWCKMTKPKDEFLGIGMAPVAFAHEVARLAFQPVIGDPPKRHPYSSFNDDWSHYFQYTVLIPAVWEAHGPACWPAPNDFHETWGRSRFARLYHGAEDTYAALLTAIEKMHGREIIGRTLNELTHNGARPNLAIEDFMVHLAAATEDSSIVRRISQALPSTLEWSLNKRMLPLGFFPRLEQMIDDHCFAVDSVAVGSPAELAGIEAGAEIVGIDGFDFETAKGHAHRCILEAIHANGSIRLTVRQDARLLTPLMKIRQR